jgi:hypothetical protein
MKRAMAKQAEAERERRAKIIAAEGEYQASAKLVAAAEIIQQYPMAMQLRFLQTVVEIAAENNSTTLFPIPVELFRHMVPSGGTSPNDEERVRALRAAAEAMVESLPKSGDRGSLESAAKTMLGMSTERRARERVGPPDTDD